jgi:hypothetical protein
VRTLPILLLLALSACAPWVAPDAPDPTPTPAPTPTPPEPGRWTPSISDALLRNPDAGWVASNPNRSWASITTRAGGAEPYRAASVIDMTMSLADWLAPADGSDPDDAATGSGAGRVQEALDRRRYVALGIFADDVDDLPAAWATTDTPFDPSDPLQASPDGLISVLDLGDRVAPNYADPDYWQRLGSVVAALGDRFGGAPGVAFVHVSGIGDGGMFTFADPAPWFEGSAAPFTEITWPVITNTVATTWEQSFPFSTPFLSWRSIEHAFDQGAFLDMLANENFQLQDGCLGGCDEPDFDRFPGGPGTPYPDDDPFGGWLPGELAGSKALLGAGGLGGIADWRMAERDGGWDEGAFGPVDEYLGSVLDAALAHSGLRFVSLGGSACRSEWVTADVLASTPCATQTPGDLWAPIEEFGRRLGTRYAVLEVRAPSQEPSGSAWPVEIDVANLGDGRDFDDRVIEVGFQDLGSGEPLDTVTLEPDPPTSQWTPGSTSTLLVDLPLAALNSADPDAFALTIRLPDDRAFGGGIELAHDERDDAGRHVLVRWPAE